MKVQNVAIQLKLAESLMQFYTDQPMERQLFEGTTCTFMRTPLL